MVKLSGIIAAAAVTFTTIAGMAAVRPAVSFVHSGRYLPPVGNREILIESVNATNAVAEVRRVPAQNAVIMMALDNDEYRLVERAWYAGEGFAADLADAARKTAIPTGEVNVASTNRLDFSEGKNGIFLISLSAKNIARDRHRLICVTDLGLSVRTDADAPLVWVTSLTSGRPLAEVKISVYSSANIRVAEGVSDADGLARCKRIAAGEPFAVIAETADGGDMGILALKGAGEVDERAHRSGRENYLKPGELSAFLWSDRGIYRHGESIFVHSLLRREDGQPAAGVKTELVLLTPTRKVFARADLTTDDFGVVCHDKFAVPAEQPGGKWILELREIDGKNKKTLGSRTLRIEEFAPPQIRVAVESKTENASGWPFCFEVSAEHLFGGVANGLLSEAMVMIEDAKFEPKGWENYCFGCENRSLQPTFVHFDTEALDKKGRRNFQVDWPDDRGMPGAAVKLTAQGTVFEDGGRAANARVSLLRHYYPYYMGAAMKKWFSDKTIPFACVETDGSRSKVSRRLKVVFEKIDNEVVYEKSGDFVSSRFKNKYTVVENGEFFIDTLPDRDFEIKVPEIPSGNSYRLTVLDPMSEVAFAQEFYYLDDDFEESDSVKKYSDAENPSRITLSVDKKSYVAGEKPKLFVKSPFAGSALLTVAREKILYTEVLELKNAVSEIELRPLTAEDAPNLEVRLSIVQSAMAGRRGIAGRAHGEATVMVRLPEREIEVALTPSVELNEAGGKVFVDVLAPGADYAAVTLVDEAINIFTSEKTPDPIGFFARSRIGNDRLFDIFWRILPVLGEDALRAFGIKIGGGMDIGLFSRISPTPTRRFRPLALWREKVALDAEGRGRVEFGLPEFAGEVRLTALAYSRKAVGASSVQCKITPRLIMHPDAPRFVAPKDVFDITLPIYNRAGESGEVAYSVASNRGSFRLEAGDSTNLCFRLIAPADPGEMAIDFEVAGFGERHRDVIQLPVRPAVPWLETAGIKIFAADEAAPTNTPRMIWREVDSGEAELAAAYDWLAAYPYGCLEQTSSRAFPLLDLPDRKKYVEACVLRVESMIRYNNFTMWPDSDVQPWNDEVSIYAAHFLFEAERAGFEVLPKIKERALRFMNRYVNGDYRNSDKVYALLTLAIAGHPDRDGMMSFYEKRNKLQLLDRSRLALAFIEIGDRRRATELLGETFTVPGSIKEAAFSMLAAMALKVEDAQLNKLAVYLASHRDRARYCWGTTADNAHALLALGRYYRQRTAGKPGERWFAWHKLELPAPDSVKAEANGIKIERVYRDAKGAKIDVSQLRKGMLVEVDLTLASDVKRTYEDLVIEDLLPAAFEPIRAAENLKFGGEDEDGEPWLLRSDMRDDRMLVFTRRFTLEKGSEVHFRYQVRVVTSGSFVLPGASVEAMYAPDLRARGVPGRIVVVD